MFHHHTTAFLPTLMACLPRVSTTPTLHQHHRTNPAHRPAVVQNVSASARPLWQTSAPSCPGRPVSVLATMRSCRANPLLPLPHHLAQARPPYWKDSQLLTPPHAQDCPDTC